MFLLRMFSGRLYLIMSPQSSICQASLSVLDLSVSCMNIDDRRVVSNFIAQALRSPPKIPEVAIPEKSLLEIVTALRIEINQGLATIRDIA
ncbi:hypothetical protein Tco_1095723 [Tanacetum coccineum]